MFRIHISKCKLLHTQLREHLLHQNLTSIPCQLLELSHHSYTTRAPEVRRLNSGNLEQSGDWAFKNDIEDKEKFGKPMNDDVVK